MMFGKEIIEGIVRSEEELEIRGLNEKEKEKAFSLRYKIFGEKLGWLVPNPYELDYDSYDNYAKHVGVFIKNEKASKMIGYARIIFSGDNFMIHEEFKALLDEPIKKNSLEISRVLVDTPRPDYRLYTTMLLYREVYLSAEDRGIRYGYIVVVENFLKKLQMVFPFERVGKTIYFQEKIPTVAAIVDSREIEKKFISESEKLHDWFVGGSS
jgi:N-acyl-L-homoserine lactone synthetase